MRRIYYLTWITQLRHPGILSSYGLKRDLTNVVLSVFAKDLPISGSNIITKAAIKTVLWPFTIPLVF